MILLSIPTGLSGGTKSESYIAGIKEIEGCLLKEPLTMNCLDIDCQIKKCIKLGYDLLFENSNYSLKKNHDVSRTAHCAIDKCAKGVMERKDNAEGLFSGWTEPILACLRSVSSCVKNNPRDEL
ncbi:hypothetical protein PDJAM_G00049730 [Pangasius djambal]|uniref:Uncharacterized protein n=1 Tax=Pangasius djambal TaxID=1691987 RepID=A0ACC5YVJ1_9TELE|nr:hypothetical protein [Pangasius djambal]